MKNKEDSEEYQLTDQFNSTQTDMFQSEHTNALNSIVQLVQNNSKPKFQESEDIEHMISIYIHL